MKKYKRRWFLISISKLSEKEEQCDSDSNQKSLQKILTKLIKAIPKVKVVAIVSIEGLPIISILPPDIEELQVAATTATILCMAERAILELKAGNLEKMYVEGSDLNILISAIGQNAVLMIATSKQVVLSKIFLHCKKVCKNIAKLI